VGQELRDGTAKNPMTSPQQLRSRAAGPWLRFDRWFRPAGKGALGVARLAWCVGLCTGLCLSQGLAQAQTARSDMAALTEWVDPHASPAPAWSDADVRASRVETAGAKDLPSRPAWQADPMNLFVVVEGGDPHVALVDADRFEVIHRFASRHALQGSPQFTPDGRYMFLGSRDGWITQYDLWNRTVVAEVRAGLALLNLAVSSDGRWVMAANASPRTVRLFDAALNLVQRYDAATLDGKQASRVSAVVDAAPRKSFVVALKDIPELWEISYDPRLRPSMTGWCTTTAWAKPSPGPASRACAARRSRRRWTTSFSTPGPAMCWAPPAPQAVRPTARPRCR